MRVAYDKREFIEKLADKEKNWFWEEISPTGRERVWMKVDEGYFVIVNANRIETSPATWDEIVEWLNDDQWVTTNYNVRHYNVEELQSSKETSTTTKKEVLLRMIL